MVFDSYGIHEHQLDQEGVYNHSSYGEVLFHKSSFKKEWLDEYVPNPTVIFDIGCYDGGDSLRFLSWCPNASIYCFEPVKENYELTLQKIGKTKINIINSAVFNIDGELEFAKVGRVQSDGTMGDFMGGFYPYTSGHLTNHGVSSLPNEKVKSVTVKTFCSTNNIDHIDFAHIDVEGAGCEVIDGMKDMLPKLVFIEHQSPGAFNGKNAGEGDLINLFVNNGYTLVKHLPNDYLFLKN